ncbi:MAG: diadenylate cyclase CdaA [Oscillospiraceae bacterium]|nr:diadenylate cyclase CdaA [Oscillospiraceae bacterium]
MDQIIENIQSFFLQITKMGLPDYLDILIVGFLIYRLIPMLRASGAMRVVKVIGLLLVISWLTEVFELYTLNFILSMLLDVGLVAIVILFQPELRRMLDHLGNVKWKRFLGIEKQSQEMINVINQTVAACEIMSQQRVGALIVFARDNPMDEYFKRGTMIEAQVSEQLIRNIFFPKAALHDGAMIIRDSKIAAAGCVLPLSDSHSLSADLGTRHRAGVGMSEVSDAVVVIVSEETGTISVAVGGVLKRYLAPQTLGRLLRSELCHEETGEHRDLPMRLKQRLQKKEKGEE